MKKVVFIDDDEINNFILENKVKTEIPDAESLCFLSAQAGLDYLEAHADAPPQVIFLDVKMPEMNGFDFLDEYHRRMYHENLFTRIFMLSSSVDASDQERSKNYSSVEGFLSKPLKNEELQKIRDRMLR
jgi:CheY-like chemotaxis protein